MQRELAPGVTAHSGLYAGQHHPGGSGICLLQCECANLEIPPKLGVSLSLAPSLSVEGCLARGAYSRGLKYLWGFFSLNPCMGSSQDQGPVLVPLTTRCRNIIHNHKGPITLRTTLNPTPYILLYNPSFHFIFHFIFHLILHNWGKNIPKP